MKKRFKKWLAGILRNELLEFVKPPVQNETKIEMVHHFDFTKFRAYGKIGNMHNTDFTQYTVPEVEKLKDDLLKYVRDNITIYRREDYRIGYCELIAELVIGVRR